VTTRAPAPPPLDAGLEGLLRRMRLPRIRRTPEVPATANAHRGDPAEVLRILLTEEVADRDRSALATRRARAAFPTGKTFAARNKALSSIPAPTQSALRTLEWIGRHENLVVCGPAGTGKTFLLEALGQAAVENGRHVAWFTLESLGVLVRRHRAGDSLTRAIARILRADLVIVDDIGLLPVSTDAAERLYRLTDAANELRSVAISSNLRPSGFDELMPKTLATATVDRLLHHAHLCQTTGDSIRLSQALAGKGLKPRSKITRAHLMAATGQIPRPSAGTTHDRHRADLNGHLTIGEGATGNTVAILGVAREAA
jgi:DNA replication protein DnaC